MRITQAAAVGGLVVSLFGCSGSEPQESAKAVVVLLEPNPALRSVAVEQALSIVLDAIRPGDALAVAVVGDRIRPAEVAAREVFPAFEPTTDNRLLRERQQREHEERHAARLEQVSEELREEIDRAFDRDRDGLALLSSMELAGRLFATYLDRRPILIVLSSMMERTDRLNFVAEKPTAEVTGNILAELQTEGLLPNLSSVRVYVAGARDPDPGRFVEIRDFWLTYFNAGGAQIHVEDYGAALLRDELD